MTDYRVSKGEVSEDHLTAAIEKHTSQIPSGAHLAAALAAMAVSAGLHLAKKEHPALLVGQWAAPFLLLGIYNKLVKHHESDPARPVGVIPDRQGQQAHAERSCPTTRVKQQKTARQANQITSA